MLSTKQHWRWIAGLFFAVWIVHDVCPVASSSDSRWTVPLALSLLHRGDLNLDEYADLFATEKYSGVECVSPDHTLLPPDLPSCNGHYYYWYPPASSVVLAPLIGGLEAVVHLAVPLMRGLAAASAHPVLHAFFSGDMVRGHALAELILASLLVALTTVVIFVIALEYLRPPWAALVALVFAFGTSAWSTASRALWQHTPSALMLSLAVLLLVRSRTRPYLAAWTALPLALAYAIRPTNAIPVAAVTLLVFFWRRRWFPLFLLLAAPVAALFFAFNIAVYGKLFSPYHSMQPPLPLAPAAVAAYLRALAGNLVSPSRGLFIFTPVLLFAVYGMYRALRTRWESPLGLCFAAIVVAHWLVISLYTEFWWAGHCYGPRLFTDVLPFLCFFLIPVFQKWQQQGVKRATVAVFVLLLAVSVAVHARGATSIVAWEWNVNPVNVDSRPDRVWDWRDAQPLRGLR